MKRNIILYIILLFPNIIFSQDDNCNFDIEVFNEFDIPLNISPKKLKELYSIKEKGYLSGKYNRKDLYHYSLENEINFLDKRKKILIDFAFKNNKLVYYKIEMLNVSYDELKTFKNYLTNKFPRNKNNLIYSYKNTFCTVTIWLINNKIKIIKVLKSF